MRRRHPVALTARISVAWPIGLLALWGCRDSPRAPAIVLRDSAGIAIVENDLARLPDTCRLGATPTVTIGMEEGPEEYQLFQVFGARRLTDGRIALVNQGSQQLRLYDRQGRFVSQAGRRGGGPGEFRDAFYLWVLPGDTIWVGDYRPWRYLVFGPDGQWVRTVQMDPMYVNPPADVSVLDDGRSVLGLSDRGLSRPGTQFELAHLGVVVHDADGAFLDSIGTYPDGRWGRMEDDPGAMMLYPMFESFAHVTGAGSSIVVAHGSKAEYSMLAGPDGFRVRRIVRWTAGDRTISQADIEAERARLAGPFRDRSPGERRRFLDPLVSPDRPVADRFPAVAGLLAGRDGRIWVREYQPPSAPGPRRWLAFDAEGRFQCRATLPDFSEILEFGADYLLVEDRDEVGIERVLQYPLGPPGPP